jgi:sterol desaturase/sphingolipid hydroxylase (fatty acid hydroxylase superfamily)
MADEGISMRGSNEKATSGRREWNWVPALPIEMAPLFAWPQNPVKTAKWFVGLWLPLTDRMAILLITAIAWFYLHPALERCQTLEPGWIAEILLRNLGVTILVAGGLHLYFHRFKKQGVERKFDPGDPTREQRKFTFSSQVFDNIFWTLASGVTVWTVYEVLFMWGYANGYLPALDWSGNPVWFVLLILLIPHWSSIHFYLIHRFLHWPPLYRIAHLVHHRNIFIGPWSGLSMHPVEHILFFSSVLVHGLVASHPIHLLYHLQFKALTAVTSHTGFERLLVRDGSGVMLGDFFHQLHHRYFECNYGGTDIPFDKWFGTFHDGTQESKQRLRDRFMPTCKE